jgi:hypothetical protein
VSNFVYHDVEQNSDEWFQLRAGKLTSSNISKVMANEGKAFGDPAKKLAVVLAVERLTGQPTGEGYSNEHMERGHEQEPLARMLYEETQFTVVQNGGFFDCGDQGCSPDGLVGEAGLIEIKSAIPSIHYARVKRGTVDPAYKWQCVMNLEKTEREWLDFISYCHDYPEGKRLFIYRLWRGHVEDEAKRLRDRIRQFTELVDETTARIETGTYEVLAA